MLSAIGKAFKPGFSVGIRSDLEIELVQVHESVGDMDADVGGIDRHAGVVGDGEIGGAGAQTGVDDGDGFRVQRQGGDGPKGDSKGRDGEDDTEERLTASDPQHTYQSTPKVGGRRFVPRRGPNVRPAASRYVKRPLALAVLVTNGHCLGWDANL